MILGNMPEISKELQRRKLRKGKYSPELRKFALTLNFFSPKGYNYVWQVFDTCLPHASTIGTWFKNINAEPGFTSEAFDYLKVHLKNCDKQPILSLIVDEISIRKHVEWDGKKFHGYINFGVDLEDDSNEMATEALVLMVVCINGKWKLPIGYFFTNGLNGEQKSAIISQCIF